MAQMDTGGGGGKHDGKVRGKKMSTRVDMTPLVDLAFLLITFFMLTTSLNKPKAQELNMPKKIEDSTEKTDVKECQVLNIILDKDDIVWYYDGIKVAGLQKTGLGEKGIRKVISRRHKFIKTDPLCQSEKTKKPKDLIVLIKTAKGSKYKQMVGILDEMAITETKIYAIQDLSDIEKEAIENGGVVKSFATE